MSDSKKAAALQAVKDGRVDCGIVFEWDASIAEAQGLQVMFGLGEQLGPIAFTAAMVKEDSLKSAADLIQKDLSEGKKGGYVFTITPTPTGYAVNANPETFNSSGRRTFYSDQTLVVRNNWSQEPANANSPEIK